ncbi:GntR family transcriptional regulator [Clostridium celatum]|uniref:Transcriptional regulator, GntR family n=1 Tax=Clostridium celatum DSM 1785 TaxID=545697 RepID=L1QIE3_9CLOT|nr:GntR family transcriptional regulator [Clostridium celatum]EKY27748.1 transcriptional regulator, GntR family [Clostridium celatum DSM 1785]MCE9656075.1 GntR family transcriptional regulator [Clostridium celatum]MDU2266320.1 GntR family transcriptional regulator [Clostridium celatum]MDU6296617.1 GntR family transcriptional regulator [Clostridium celatum]MDY3361239.1 GntR family transcriptional regulator [Clostridium celatum]
MILYDKLDKETGKDYVYRVLKDNIMCLELKPGELLSESELAKRLNVSRTPIREVLIKLKAEKLIEVKPQAGTYVSLIDWNLIEEAIFIRYNLEKEALKEACEKFSEDTLMEMEKCLFAQKLVAQKGDNLLEFHNLDKEFHKLLFKGINKVNVWESICNISTHYNRMRLLAELKLNKEFLVDQHITYLDIIKNKDINHIEEVVSHHIKEPVEQWKKLIKENSEIAKYIV